MAATIKLVSGGIVNATDNVDEILARMGAGEMFRVQVQEKDQARGRIDLFLNRIHVLSVQRAGDEATDAEV